MTQGMSAGLLGVSHGAFQFVAYEELKAGVNRSRGQHPDAKLVRCLSVRVIIRDELQGQMDYLWMSGTSKVFAQVITYPYQVIRSRLQNVRYFSFPRLSDTSDRA